MDAKRIVPLLHVLEGRVVAPDTGADLGLPSKWARRLELQGADEVLFLEQGRGRHLRQGWLTAVARSLFIPFALEAPFGDADEVAEALQDGADRVVVPAAVLASLDPDRFGRSRFAAALEVSKAEDWAPALARMAELGQAGAGELLLEAGTEALAELCTQLARLPMPVLLRCADPDQAVVALAHGADGVVFPAALRTAHEFKELLVPAGVPLRR
jgi:thiazole synthase ThiGH ThiG subunit